MQISVLQLPACASFDRKRVVIALLLCLQVKILMQKMARREVERQMTEEQRQRERAIQVSQLDAIFRLVEQQKSEYAAKGGSWDLLDSAQGENGSLPTAEGHFEAIREQMKMYLE